MAGGRVLRTTSGPVTVAQLLDSFWRHVEQHYRDHDGKPTNEQSEFRYALRPLRHLYGELPAAEFSPLKLKAVRELMVNGYTHPKYGDQEALSRGVINHRIRRIVRCFKWGVAEELVSGTIHQELETVRGLEKGRSQARETKPVKPIALAHVEATLPFLNRHQAAMVRLQMFAGMRPGEVCIIRACDLDMSGHIWLYRPQKHKGQHRGKERIIALGPKAQGVIRPFLSLDLQAYLFSPAEADAERQEARTAARKTPLSYGNRRGTNRKRTPKKKPGKHYTPSSYQHAISKAIKKADAAAVKKAIEGARQRGETPPGDDIISVPHWHAHQLRHTHATEVRRKYGLEAAQVALGHSQANVTEIYAERDLTLALKVAAEMG